MTNSAKSSAEDGFSGRGFGLPSRGETSWRQTLLVPPEQVTVRLDLGWLQPEHLGMFAAEAFVSGTRELLALEVHPIRRYDHLGDWLGRAQSWQRDVVQSVFDVDPF